MIIITIEEKNGKITMVPLPSSPTNDEKVVAQYVMKAAVEQYVETNKNIKVEEQTLGTFLGRS